MVRQRRSWMGATLVALAMVVVAPHEFAGRHVVRAAAASYRLVENWPMWPPGSKFEYASGVAVDAKGNVYAVTRDTDEKAGKGGSGSIYKFDRSGKFLGMLGGRDEFVTPHSVYVDHDGFLWTVDRDGHQVKKWSPEGKVLMTLGKRRVFGNGPDSFNGPTSVEVLANGDFVVSDGYWNSRLVWFNKDGKFLKQVGSYGRGPGQFEDAHWMAQIPGGRLAVVDLCGGADHGDAIVPGQIAEERLKRTPDCADRIQIFDPEGKHLGYWTTLKKPLSLAVVGERVYVGENVVKDADVVILDAASGKQVDIIKGAGISHVHSVAVDARNGDVYVASVYPEHGGGKRGPEGASLRRWTRAEK